MNTKNTEKLNKQISQHYVNHACTISSPGQVAKDLGLESSRISELRSGGRQLKREEAEIIREIYGLPSTSNAHWTYSELTSSKSFELDFVDNGYINHLLILVEKINDSVFIDRLLSTILVKECEISGYVNAIHVSPPDERESVEKNNERLIKAHKIDLFKRLLEEPKFELWCRALTGLLNDGTVEVNRDFEGNVMYYKDILCSRVINGTVQWDYPTSDFSSLERICSDIEKGFSLTCYATLIYSSFKDFAASLLAVYEVWNLIESNTYAHVLPSCTTLILAKNLNRYDVKRPAKEYAVVGKCVWKTNNKIRLDKKIVQPSILKYQFRPENPPISRDGLFPLDIEFLSAHLFYTEQFNFYFKLECFADNLGTFARSFLIKIENRKNVIEEVLSVFSFFGIDDIFTEHSIKKAIAENGGYVPSTTYLE